jgi:hypothetical protein
VPLAHSQIDFSMGPKNWNTYGAIDGGARLVGICQGFVIRDDFDHEMEHDRRVGGRCAAVG